MAARASTRSPSPADPVFAVSDRPRRERLEEDEEEEAKDEDDEEEEEEDFSGGMPRLVSTFSTKLINLSNQPPCGPDEEKNRRGGKRDRTLGQPFESVGLEGGLESATTDIHECTEESLLDLRRDSIQTPGKRQVINQ